MTPSVNSWTLGDASWSPISALTPGTSGVPRIGRSVPPLALNQSNSVCRAWAVGTGLAGLPVFTAGPR